MKSSFYTLPLRTVGHKHLLSTVVRVSVICVARATYANYARHAGVYLFRKYVAAYTFRNCVNINAAAHYALADEQALIMLDIELMIQLHCYAILSASRSRCTMPRF